MLETECLHAGLLSGLPQHASAGHQPRFSIS